jgi:hypothetical protein
VVVQRHPQLIRQSRVGRPSHRRPLRSRSRSARASFGPAPANIPGRVVGFQIILDIHGKEYGIDRHGGMIFADNPRAEGDGAPAKRRFSSSADCTGQPPRAPACRRQGPPGRMPTAASLLTHPRPRL